MLQGFHHVRSRSTTGTQTCKRCCRCAVLRRRKYIDWTLTGTLLHRSLVACLIGWLVDWLMIPSNEHSFMILLLSCAGTSYVFGHWIYRDCLHSAHIWQDCCIKYSSMDRCKQHCSLLHHQWRISCLRWVLESNIFSSWSAHDHERKRFSILSRERIQT